MEEVLREGGKVVGEELSNFLRDKNEGVYLRVLKVLVGGARWSEVKRALEQEFGEVNNKRVSDILGVLTSSFLVEKKGQTYCIPDPVLRRVVLEART